MKSPGQFYLHPDDGSSILRIQTGNNQRRETVGRETVGSDLAIIRAQILRWADCPRTPRIGFGRIGSGISGRRELGYRDCCEPRRALAIRD